MIEKLTVEYIREQFKKEKYELLSEKYINNNTKLEYICPKGHKHNVSWHNWQKGRRCPYCSGYFRKTIEFVRSEFKKEGYRLLTTEYKNNTQKLGYVCPKGHKHSTTWDNWNAGYKCPYCAGNAKLTIEFIRLELKKEGYVFLTEKYRNNKQKLFYKCFRGREGNTTWDNWNHGKRCPICATMENSGKNHYNWQGGIACEPYCPIWLDKEFKKSILERDNYQCQNPDCWGTGSKLTGHHIDYDKKNCNRSNIITVCDSCNSRANHDREYWTEFYRNIINKKYGYTYERTIGKNI